MSKLTLRNFLGKNKDALAAVVTLLEELNAAVFIEDLEGHLLVGKTFDAPAHQYELVAGEELLGYVKGDEKAFIVSKLFSVILAKESEKKKLGNEVLNVYQELNLIFNFSERLAEAIEPGIIAQIALDEARHLIEASAGMVLLQNERKESLELLASFGDLFFGSSEFQNKSGLLFNILKGAQPEIISDFSEIIGEGSSNYPIKELIYAPLKVKQRVMGVIILANDQPVLYTAGHLKLLTTLALQSSSAIDSALLYEKNICEVREREEAMKRIHEVTNKFVPYEFIHALGKEVLTDVKLGDQTEKIVTVLFTDIRDYTTLAEKMTPEENFSFISYINELLGPIVHEFHGFIIQYLGDAIMAIFPGKAMDSVAAAVAIQRAVEIFNSEQVLKKLPAIQVGIGMHTGPLIMGIIGDGHRLAPAMISDTVNTAARIESLTKFYKADILLSEATLQALDNQEDFLFRYLGLVQLKGKKAPTGIFECFSGNKENDLKKKMATLGTFNEGLSFYLNKSFVKAASAFHNVIEIHPDDHTAKLFLSKAAKYISAEVPENWTGVEEMIIK
ncbi:GAF domain-containing protein [Chitinophagaceae bacterium LB-8]|uniref:GAF domain-containing protein n=1 Tax=Paraflavisolibacter caeni TaxID=2982496 RepID=A0A9X3BHH0_9BACT|nr:adenylate/guanylate cyclase domain-containing protein [Paraflavisolibacter caeni]MCU7549607.1 GAF domain-containing protein [Paraflavisolibacter caeni]